MIEVHGTPAAISIADVQLPRHEGILASDVLPDVPRIFFIYVLVPLRLCDAPAICATALWSPPSHRAAR